MINDIVEKYKSVNETIRKNSKKCKIYEKNIKNI